MRNDEQNFPSYIRVRIRESIVDILYEYTTCVIHCCETRASTKFEINLKICMQTESIRTFALEEVSCMHYESHLYLHIFIKGSPVNVLL